MGEGCNVKLSWKDIRGVRYQGVTPPQIKLNIKLTHLDLRSSGTEWVSKTTVHGEGRVGRGRGLQNTFELERHKGGPAYGDNPQNRSTDVKLAHLDLRSSGTEWFSKMTVHGEGRVGHGRGLQGDFELERHKGG